MKKHLIELSLWVINPMWRPMKAFGLYVKYASMILWKRFLMWYGKTMCNIFIKVYDKLPSTLKTYVPPDYEGVDSIKHFNYPPVIR